MIVRQLEVCPDRRLHWPVDAEPVCTDRRHEHRRIAVHVHRDEVVLPDATVVTAASFDPAGDPYRRDRAPDAGLYLDPRWAPPWPHDRLDWPDFGLPADVTEVRRALAGLRRRAVRGDRVELGCLGGHGRTGTALACLAVLAGLPAEQGVAWVRANYCPDAVETEQQQDFVRRFGRHVRGHP